MATSQSENENQKAKLFGDIFVYNKTTKKSKCILQKEGKECGTEISGSRQFNLRRHVATIHSDFKATIVDGKSKIDTSEQALLNIWTEIVTVNGRPFSIIKDSGMKKLTTLLNDLIQAQGGKEIHIDDSKLKANIQIMASRIKRKIMEETKDTMVSLMMDIGSKNHREILGVNIQYILNGRIVVRTLENIRLEQSHTGKYLAEVVKKILEDNYKISVKKQLYTVNTDNASYMLLSSQMLENIAGNESTDEVNVALNFHEVEEEFYRAMLKEAEVEFFGKEVADFVNSVPCGAHNFQLAVNDALKACSEGTLIETVQSIVVKLRTPTVIRAIKEKNLKMPLLYNSTRWSGKYTMVKRFLELKDFVSMLAISNSSLKLNEEDWEQLVAIRDILEHCYFFTKKIQSEQMTLSDFYAEWKELKFKLKKEQSSDFVANLLICMDEREKKFLESPIVLAAIFMDTRYRILLNENPASKQIAMNHLALLWKRIQDLKSPIQGSAVPNFEQPNVQIDDVDTYLDSLESNSATQPQITCEDIMTKLTEFDMDMNTKKREPKKNHAMDYWERVKINKPELHELAKVIFAVASTEVSVERNFSALTYILNRYRCSLSDEILNDILLLRLNKNLFYDLI